MVLWVVSRTTRPLLSSSSSSSSICFLGQRRSLQYARQSQSQRFLSSSLSEKEPLLLSFASPQEQQQEESVRILYPRHVPVTTVETVNEAVQAIENHYCLNDNDDNDHFVGGMGESDPGVGIVGGSNGNEPLLLDAWLLTETIQRVQQARHGIPFSIYTSGMVVHNDDNDNDEEVLLETLRHFDSIRVSLLAANPMDFAKETAAVQQEDGFGRVCQFLVLAQEASLPIEVCVLQKHASAARELAMSLGARQVHVYNE